MLLKMVGRMAVLVTHANRAAVPPNSGCITARWRSSALFDYQESPDLAEPVEIKRRCADPAAGSQLPGVDQVLGEMELHSVLGPYVCAG